MLFACNLKWPLLDNLGSLKLDHWQFISAHYSNLPQDHVTVKHVFIQETVLALPDPNYSDLDLSKSKTFVV